MLRVYESGGKGMKSERVETLRVTRFCIAEMGRIEFLLRFDMTPKECSRLSGVNVSVVRKLWKQKGLSEVRNGRRPLRLVRRLTDPVLNIWIACFLQKIKILKAQKRLDDVNAMTFIEAMTFVSMMSCRQDPIVSPRTLLTAIDLEKDGAIELSQCKRCDTYFIKATEWPNVGQMMKELGNPCPFCRQLKEMKHRSVISHRIDVESSDDDGKVVDCSVTESESKEGVSLSF